MEAFRYHVFLCTQQKPDGVPCCSARGAAPVLETLRREINACGLEDEVQITTCGSLGLCEHGPNMVVYPDGLWYSGVTPADVPEIVRAHFQEGNPVERLIRTDPAPLRAEILNNRQKMYAGMRAREAAGVLPDELTVAVRAFQESRAILTALELDLFAAAAHPATAFEIAARIQTDPRATEMLLNVLTSLNLVVKAEGIFQISPNGALLDKARTGLLHTAHLWHRWSSLTDCVRSGTAAADSAPRTEDWTEAFIAAMHRNASERAPQVVRAIGVDRVQRLLDVGGGSGAYSIAFAQANPKLRADILDLAAVEPIARGHIHRAALEDRVKVRVGDLRSGSLGEDYDLVFVSAICHMLSPAENLDLLRRCRAALTPHGRLVIQDFILAPDKTSPRFAALFSLNMLVGTRAGASYSYPEYAEWLDTAGFREIRAVPLPGPASLIIAS